MVWPMSDNVNRDDPSTAYLFVKDVEKQYGGKRILDNVDLVVARGEFCTLIGPSGCGKSTLLRLILGAEKPTSGRILLNGEDNGPPDTNRGIVFQRYSLFPNLSVIDNVLLGTRLSANKNIWDKQQAKKVAYEFLDRMRLSAHADKYPYELSGGMRQRVAIAQSVILKPEILLMDEPFGALDPDTREDMQLLLLELWEEYGMTVFFVTHDLEEAAYLGTRILVLSQYYTDDRGDNLDVNRGAKIVADHQLRSIAKGTEIKRSLEFAELIRQIRQEGFNPEYLQHAKDFNLSHPDSFRTLTVNESSEKTT